MLTNADLLYDCLTVIGIIDIKPKTENMQVT